MRTYSIEDYPENVERYFDFLITDFGFKLTEKRERKFGYLVVFEKDDRKVVLNFDYMDNYYYFSIVRGKETVYSDEETENIITFYDLAKNKNAEINLQELQPDDKQFLKALKNNTEILQQFGGQVLKGKEWMR
jgi:hypothetical protein